MEANFEEEYKRLNNDSSKVKQPKEFDMKDNMNWIMIAVLSVVQVLLSCLSSLDGQIQFVFPTTVMGWILLFAPKIAISALGYMIWLEFFGKGKQMAQKTKEYKDAKKILMELQGKSEENILQVVNPKVWETKVKVKKGIKVIITTFLTATLIAALAIAFNWASLIGSVVSLLMSAVWGLNMMTQAEEQWSTGYLNYANWMKINYDKQNAHIENIIELQNQTKTDEISKTSNEGDNVDQCVNMEPTEALNEESRPDICDTVDN